MTLSEIDTRLVAQWAETDPEARFRVCVVCQRDVTADHLGSAFSDCLGAPPLPRVTLSAVQRERLADTNSLDLNVYARQTTLRTLNKFGLVKVTAHNWDNPWAPATLEGFKLACVLNMPHRPERIAALLRRARAVDWIFPA